MVKLAIGGCCGRMGSRILELALKDKDCEVVCIWERSGHASLNCQVCGFTVTDRKDKIKNADCLIDFTAPQATMENVKLCLEFKKAIVIGTTGLDEAQISEIKDAAKCIPIILSPNMSVGVNLLFNLVKEAAEILSNDYHVNIIEAHHVHKKDAPSGTAKKLAEVVKEATKNNDIDIESIREGEIIGDHRVVFASPVDSIELYHSANTRDIFAQGAIVAAKWIINKGSGFFNMQDVLKKGR